MLLVDHIKKDKYAICHNCKGVGMIGDHGEDCPMCEGRGLVQVAVVCIRQCPRCAQDKVLRPFLDALTEANDVCQHSIRHETRMMALHTKGEIEKAFCKVEEKAWHLGYRPLV